MENQRQFVQDWNIIHTLGEGAFGQVKLLVHQTTQQAVAVKIIDLENHRNSLKSDDSSESQASLESQIDKEVRIHRVLMHPNVIRLFGKRQEPDKLYIFMEYASGGELFNRIEPDLGMPKRVARSYMKQILDGVQYLHSKGVTHRDIKPENLLLDEHDVIKISDFGLATVFRLRGKERLLDKRCGTLPYVAPEVLEGPYRAEPADLWSCGIVLITMLAGELPWDEPTESCIEYEKFKRESGLLNPPWSKLDTVSLSLARKILTPDPTSRPTIEQILRHPFLIDNFENDVVDAKSILSEDSPCMTLSQPTLKITVPPDSLQLLLSQNPNRTKPVCFSQPINNEDLILGSQIQFTQSPVTHVNFQHLIKRMTRFFVKTTIEETVKRLGVVLDHLQYRWNINAEAAVIISTVDSRKTKLVFKANFIKMDGKLLLDFQLGKGCGIDFKRKFIKIKDSLKDIIISNP